LPVIHEQRINLIFAVNFDFGQRNSDVNHFDIDSHV
jgi:hypothetical protein